MTWMLLNEAFKVIFSDKSADIQTGLIYSIMKIDYTLNGVQHNEINKILFIVSDVVFWVKAPSSHRVLGIDQNVNTLHKMNII